MRRVGCNQTVCTIRAQYDVSARPWDPLCSTSEPAAQAPKQGTAYDPGQHRACPNTPSQCGLISIISYGNDNDKDNGNDNGNHRSICQFVFDKHPRRRRTWCPPAAQYNKHLTCAVYYRMVAGSFKRQGNGILAAPALDQTNLMITRTKALGAALGHTEADYLSDWSDTLGVMTDQMNRNYDNIRQLKTRYQNRCKALND
ncbi:hypothetical protein N8295_02320 [Pseudomonadales bacterium]|nr:hypothetical protein [Pseudomonadales bacterium]MDC1366775.1 hypothetical protein [Pseudomonadales bacterium]